MDERITFDIYNKPHIQDDHLRNTISEIAFNAPRASEFSLINKEGSLFLDVDMTNSYSIYNCDFNNTLPGENTKEGFFRYLRSNFIYYTNVDTFVRILLPKQDDEIIYHIPVEETKECHISQELDSFLNTFKRMGGDKQ